MPRSFHVSAQGLPRLERFLEAIQASGKDLRHAAHSLGLASLGAVGVIVFMVAE